MSTRVPHARHARPTTPLRGRTGALRRAVGEMLAQTCSLVAPRRCPCGHEDAWLCARCRDLLAAAPLRVESCCDALQLLSAARVREEGPHLPSGVDHEPLLPVLALGEHTGDLQRLVLAWKNGGMLHLGAPIADGLTTAVRRLEGEVGGDAGSGPPLLVPVPSRLGARLRRGEDHTAELVRTMSRSGAGRPLLLRAVPTTGQGGQGARQRRTRRIRLTSEVPQELRDAGAKVVIVDDVVTTGATLRGMHEVLTEAGLQVVGAVVVASARVPVRSRTIDQETLQESWHAVPTRHRSESPSRGGAEPSRGAIVAGLRERPHHR